jgi:hypothetical protein
MEQTFKYNGRDKPQGFLLDLDEVKSWLRVDSTADDLLLTELIKSAEFMFEDYTGRLAEWENVAIMVNPYGVENPVFTMPLLPINRVTAVVDNEQNPVQYESNMASGTVTITEDVSEKDFLLIAYEGKSNDGILQGIRVILLQIVALLYENRGDTQADLSLGKIPGIDQYKLKLWI